MQEVALGPDSSGKGLGWGCGAFQVWILMGWWKVVAVVIIIVEKEREKGEKP